MQIGTQLNTGNNISQQSITTRYQATPDPCGTTLLPTQTITPTLINNTANSFGGLYFVVTELGYTANQGGNTPTLCNADGGQGGHVGARLTVADAILGDGLLSGGEFFTQAFQVGLPVRARYRIFVNLYGIPAGVTATDATATLSVRHRPSVLWVGSLMRRASSSKVACAYSCH